MNQEKIDQKMLKCLHFTISKDETRPFLNGACHYSKLQALVSTNGYVATVLKRFYDESAADLIISKNFEIISREYPKMEEVIPNIAKLKAEKYTLNKHYFVKSDRPVKLFFCENGIIKQDRPEDFLFCLDARRMKYLADNTEYHVRYNNAFSPVIFDLQGNGDFNNFCLIMPLKD